MGFDFHKIIFAIMVGISHLGANLAFFCIATKEDL